MKINEYISRLTLPFKDIYTSVFTVKTETGVLIFDTGTTCEDITLRLLPFLREEGIAEDEVCAVFISHFHGDHAGGLPTLLPRLPRARVYSRSKKLREAFSDRVESPEDGQLILPSLQTVTVPGHSKDSMALLDLRSGILLSGDCLQLYGIFGSGAWASNVTLPALHLEALEKLGRLPIRRILAAHDYHPMGWDLTEPSDALRHCRESLMRLRDLIAENPSLSDEAIAELAGDERRYPRIRPAVITAVRNELV
ncbi:MAG: MBL fold metallo-hydrolase [Ruminococcaceae bacterium]|nr:MBL fold metallo-hydrolase [Oscillospiraceae bacterium]